MTCMLQQLLRNDDALLQSNLKQTSIKDLSKSPLLGADGVVNASIVSDIASVTFTALNVQSANLPDMGIRAYVPRLLMYSQESSQSRGLPAKSRQYRR